MDAMGNPSFYEQMAFQQTPPPNPMANYVTPMNNYQGSIGLITNPENELYNIELILKGKQLDHTGNEVKVGDALLNDIGVNSVMQQLKSIVTQVSIMSNFHEEDVARYIEFFSESLIKDLMYNRARYSITDAAGRDKIFTISLNFVSVIIKRAVENGERRFWKGSQQEITTTVKGAPSGQGKGFWKGLFGGSFNKA